MSSIHYKFRAELDYKTLQFDGLHIRGEQLVREICAKENLKLELFELQLQNAHTKKMYTDDELIPRNSSIIVQRSPRKDAAKIQKVQAGVNSGMVNQADASSSSLDPNIHIGSAEFENMDEAERLNHIRDQSTRAYDPSNFRRRPQGIMTGPPPPTYTCNRCYQPGHWYKNCPMLNTKRTTGIPSQELMETTADDPAAMLHPSGKYVVPIMHWKARQDTLAKKLEDGSSSPAQADRKVPPELLCPLCQSLFKEAIVTSCCGNSYCAECIEQRIIDPENRKCPGADCGRDLSITSIIPNKTLRDAAAAWLSAGAPGQPTAQGIQEPEQIRIRIGLKAPASSNAISSQQLTSGISPGSALVSQQPAPSVAVSTVPPSQTALAVSCLPSSSTLASTGIVQDVSLPPPRLHHELPPGIPGVTGLPHFPQAVPGIPNAAVPQTQPVSLNYGIAAYTAGFPPAASSGPRVSTISDEWNAFLQTKDRHDKRRDKDRPRHKDGHDSRSRRRRDSSSSSSSSSATSYSDEEERQRRRRREKESSKKRRSVEKERPRRDDHRRERDRERDRDREYRDHRDHREHRDHRDARSKDSKVSASSSSHRRDRDDEKRRDRKRDDGRKKDREEKMEEDTRERANKDVESKDEDEIDGIIAEYGNALAPETVGETRVTEEKENLNDEEISTPHEENTQSPVSKAVDEDEPAADEEPVDEENSLPSREKSLDSVNQAMETSEAEVAETKEEKMPLEEEEDDEEMEADVEMKENQEKEDEETDRKAKESQSSTMNTADEDDEGGKKSRKHKKSKKSKKHHRKEDDGDDEDEERRRKKHKKHKKEKKTKKDRRDADSDQEDDRKHRKKERDSDKKYDDEDDSDRKERKKEKNRTESYSTTDRSERNKEKEKKEDDVDDRKEKKKESDRRQDEDDKKKERKRDREHEEYDSDAPKIKVKRDEKIKDDRKESDREKDRKKEDEKEKRKERDERDKKREKEKEKEREKERAKEKEKEKEREREKEKERLKEKEKEAEKERQKEKEREKNKEKERKEKAKELVPEKPRRSVHERLQRADTVKVSSSSLSKTVPTLARKPVSFTVTSSKAASNIRVRQYSSSSSTKEQEEEDRSKQDRRKKDETDVESIGDKDKKQKSSRQLSASGPTVSMHKNTKIKFDL